MQLILHFLCINFREDLARTALHARLSFLLDMRLSYHRKCLYAERSTFSLDARNVASSSMIYGPITRLTVASVSIYALGRQRKVVLLVLATAHPGYTPGPCVLYCPSVSMWVSVPR